MTTTTATLPGQRNGRAQRNGSTHIDRLPPHSPEAEQGALGCVMLDPKTGVPECITKFARARGEVFYDLRHQTIYDALCRMYEKSEAIDLITLQQHLKDRGELEQVGGIVYLSTLGDAVPSSANLSYYLVIIHEKFILRQVIRVCTDAVARVYDYEGEVAELMDTVERDILSIRTFESRQDGKSIKALVQAAMADFDNAANKQSIVDGLPTGLADLDSISGGMHPGEMIVVSAFTSQGKSSLAMNIAEHVLLHAQQPVGVFSLEMTAEELVKRYICSHAHVNLRNVRQGRLSPSDFTNLTRAAGTISACSLHFDDTSGISIMELRARARRMKQKHGIQLLVIDYLQLLRGDGKRYDKKQEELEEISRTIKNMAKELEIPIIAVSQLNDQGKLFGSRTIGHDGDSVWKLEKQKRSAGEDGRDEDSIAVVLKVLKNRNGPTGMVNLVFLRQFTRFENASRMPEESVPAQEPMRYPD